MTFFSCLIFAWILAGNIVFVYFRKHPNILKHPNIWSCVWRYGWKGATGERRNTWLGAWIYTQIFNCIQAWENFGIFARGVSVCAIATTSEYLFEFAWERIPECLFGRLPERLRILAWVVAAICEYLLVCLSLYPHIFYVLAATFRYLLEFAWEEIPEYMFGRLQERPTIWRLSGRCYYMWIFARVLATSIQAVPKALEQIFVRHHNNSRKNSDVLNTSLCAFGYVKIHIFVWLLGKTSNIRLFSCVLEARPCFSFMCIRRLLILCMFRWRASIITCLCLKMCDLWHVCPLARASYCFIICRDIADLFYKCTPNTYTQFTQLTCIVNTYSPSMYPHPCL